MASTAESMLPKPVIRITGVSGRISRTSPSRSRPLRPGMRMSESTASKSASRRHSTALSAPVADSTRMLSSSSREASISLAL